MTKKIYTAADIKILKPQNSSARHVDISKKGFEKNFSCASAQAIEFARTLVTNNLPNLVRYKVLLGGSYDGNPLENNEHTYPENYSNSERYIDTKEDVLKLLWRNGEVPEWINVAVESATNEYTVMRLDCCGRYSNKADLMYHANEGKAPFHVLGPPEPSGFNFSSENNEN